QRHSRPRDSTIGRADGRLMADTVKASVRLTGREELELEAVVDGDGVIQSAKLTGIGGPRLLEVLREFRPKLKGKLDEIEAPSGATPEEILLRELILRAQGRWEFPYSEDELCHCRVIPTAVVDQAIC